MPALRVAPTVGALVVNHLEILAIAIKGNIGPAIPIQVGHHHRTDVLIHRNGINAKPRAGRQLVDVQGRRRIHVGGKIGFARQIVKQVDFRTQIVGHNEIVQPVAVQIRRVQQADLLVNRKDFRAGKLKALRLRFSVNAKNQTENQRRRNGKP